MLKKQLKRKSKGRNGSKEHGSSRNSRNHVISKANLRTIDPTMSTLKLNRGTSADSDSNKENIGSNISMSDPKANPKGLKLKRTSISRSDLKNININQLKLHQKFVNHRGNTLSHQISIASSAINTARELKSSHNETVKGSQQETNLKLIKDLGLK